MKSSPTFGWVTIPWKTIRHASLLLLVFTMPVVLGDLGTALILALSLTYLPNLGSRMFWHGRIRSPLAPSFATAFVLMGIAFSLAADELSDVRFILNFSALLMALPVLWSQPDVARRVWDFSGLSAAAFAGAVLAALVGVIGHYWLGIARVGWHVVNPIHFGNISVFLGFLSVAVVFTTSRPQRLLFLLGPLFGIVGALYSGSRGPMVTAAALSALTLGFLLWSMRHSLRKVIGAITVTITFAVIVIGLAASTGIGKIDQLPFQISQLLSSGDIADRSTQLRFEMYSGGLEAFFSSPLYGHGWWNLTAAVEPYVHEEFWPRIQKFTHLHSDIVDFAVGGGILGLFAYGLLIIAPIIAALTAPRGGSFLPRLYAACVLSVGFFVSGLTNLLLGNGLQTTLFAFMAAFIIGIQRPNSSPRESAHERD